NQFTGVFIEGVKTVRGRTLRAPICSYATSDDKIPIDDGRSGAAVGKREAAKFFHQRMLPEHFAVGIEPGEDTLGALHENIAGFRINGSTGGRIALVHSIAEEIVIEPLPDFFAGLGIETGNAFLQIRAFTQISHDVELSIRYHRGRLAREIGDPECSFFIRDFVREIFFEGRSVLLRAAP